MEKYMIKIITASVAALLALLLFIGISAAPAVAQEVEAASGDAEGDDYEISVNYAVQLYMQQRDTGSGPEGTDSTTDIFFKRNRLMLSGRLDEVYGIYTAIQHTGDQRIYGTDVSDTPGKSFDIIDTYVAADYSDSFRLRAGLTKDQLVRESLEGCFDPLSIDRSLFIYTNVPRQNRDFGLVLWGNAMNGLVQYRAAAMKGNDGADDPRSSLRYTGRIHVSLLNPESSNVYRGTYMAQKKVLTIGAGYQSEEDALYGDLGAQNYRKNYRALTYDAFFEYPTPAGTVTLSGAYLETQFADAYKDADPDSRSVGLDGEKNGWYAKAGFLLPGGRIQIFWRAEEWKFALLTGVYDQKIDWSAYGINYLIKGQDLRLTLEYSSNDYEKEDAANQDFKTVTAMLQFRI